MTAAQLLSTYRQSGKKVSENLAELFSFEQGIVNNAKDDLNRKFRTKLVMLLLYDFSIKDHILIRKLLDEEIKCEKATDWHENLYQLCFYLYELAQPEDIFTLYKTKFGASNFDLYCVLDREMVTARQTYDVAIAYVEKECRLNTGLLVEYPDILNEIKELKDEPDSESQEGYRKFLYGYFFGHERVARINFDLSMEINRNKLRKPWWRFW